MPVDPSQCEIRTPQGPALRHLYQVLWELFPRDRAAYQDMLATGRSFYTCQFHALYHRDQVLANVGLVPMHIWWHGRSRAIVGLAAVATVPHARRQGLAKYLMQQCLDRLDPQSPAALHTDLTVVYESIGFRDIPQNYCLTAVDNLTLDHPGLSCTQFDTVTKEQLTQMRRIYEQDYPNYDGKLIRDHLYWDFYEMMLNPYQKAKVFLCQQSDRTLGYLRFDHETDRLLIAELCCPPDQPQTAQALLHAAAQYAHQSNLKWLTLALTPEHFIWPILNNKDIPLHPETGGDRREALMVRPPAGQPITEWNNLHWSLGDKF